MKVVRSCLTEWNCLSITRNGYAVTSAQYNQSQYSSVGRLRGFLKRLRWVSAGFAKRGADEARARSLSSVRCHDFNTELPEVYSFNTQRWPKTAWHDSTQYHLKPSSPSPRRGNKRPGPGSREDCSVGSEQGLNQHNKPDHRAQTRHGQERRTYRSNERRRGLRTMYTLGYPEGPG